MTKTTNRWGIKEAIRRVNRLKKRNNPIKSLNLSNLRLTKLPSLPDNLLFLYCDNNQLTELPSLPNTLELLSCENNRLIKLPSLDELTNLQFVNVYDNPFLYNRINIVKKFPNYRFYYYSFSNYNILLKLQRKQKIKTRIKLTTKLTPILLNNMKLYKDHISVILRYL